MAADIVWNARSRRAAWCMFLLVSALASGTLKARFSESLALVQQEFAAATDAVSPGSLAVRIPF